MVITEQIAEVFQRQKERALALRKAPVEDRLFKLKQLQIWIESHVEEIQHAMYDDFKKPAMEVNITEIYPCITEIKLALAKAATWAYPRDVSTTATFLGASAKVHLEPKGVCLIISPWNYPFILAVGPMISAIAAGNTVIIKPSESSPATSDLLERMVNELFEERDVKVFPGDVDTAKELLEQPFDHIFFTGSSSVGKKIMAAASQHLSSVTLELGGKSPTIVAASASPADAAEKISWGKFLNTGQTCIAPDYVLLHESQWERFIKEMIFYTDKQYGNGENDFLNSGDYGRIINDDHFDRLVNALNEAVENGAKVLYGGSHDREERYIQPTIITDVPDESTLMKEEIFGPILPIKVYSSIDECIDFINERPKPLASYLFAQDEATYQRVLHETSSGALVLNDCVVHFSHPHLPFGGVNNSGIGKSHGKYGFEAFSNEKPVVKQRLSLNRLVYPPYTNGTEKFVNYLLKYL